MMRHDLLGKSAPGDRFMHVIRVANRLARVL